MHRASLAALAPLALLAASAAHAGTAGSPLRPLVAADLPERCQPLAQVPASSQILDTDFAAHISVANCLAGERLAQARLHPDRASIASLDMLAQPSIAILDDVIAHGDAFWRRAADAAKADLLVGMVVRMRTGANDPQDRAGIEPRLVMWMDRAGRTVAEAETAPPQNLIR